MSSKNRKRNSKEELARELVEEEDQKIDEDLENIEKKKKEVQQEKDDDVEKRLNNLRKKELEFHKYVNNEIKEILKLHQTALKNENKKSKKAKEPKKTGFTKEEPVPDQLADFIGLDRGTDMPRTDVTSLFYAELDKRGLRDENDKRIMRADKELKNLFDLPDSVNESNNPYDKNGLNFYNLQKYIGELYKEDKKRSETVNKVKEKKSSSKLLLEL